MLERRVTSGKRWFQVSGFSFDVLDRILCVNVWCDRKNRGDEYEGWIATVQAEGGAIIEAVPPCKVENPLTQVTGESALLYVLAHVEDLAKLSKGARLLADLKKKLGGFSLRYRRFS